MPANIEWQLQKQTGDLPTPRSGHSLNYIGNQKYVMYGGIEGVEKRQQIKPNQDVYTLRMLRDKWVWEKQTPGGDEIPPARCQHVAEVIPPANNKMFVFGGHQSPKVRLNDTWFFDTKDYTWTRAKGDKPAEENKESAIGGPSPRANAGSCFYKNKIYIYGGHGGLFYQRSCLDDIYTYDLETEQWEQLEINVGLQLPPPGRGGHSIFIHDDKLYAYGGWNHESVFNKIEVFDLATREWSDPDIYNNFPGPRWNHSAIMVEAIPAWKYFIFGGEFANFHEGSARSFGTALDNACYLDMETLCWSEVKPESGVTPPPREYASLVYDHDDSRLITFGGWNKEWLNDLWALNVNKVVGPPYSIASIHPNLGQLSGNVTCVIRGIGFRDNNPMVYFTPGSVAVDSPIRTSVMVSGNYISETEIHCQTPNFAVHGPRECMVQVIMSSKDLTTTACEFQFFKNTRAIKSLCYGTGLLNDMAVGEPISFFIQARNDDGENRTSGRDEFVVKIKTDEEEPTDVPCEVVDNDDGTYTVTYCVEKAVGVNIKVQFKDEYEELVPVRGTPYKASFCEDTNKAANKAIGPSLSKAAQGMIEYLQTFIRDTTAGVKLVDKDFQKDLSDVKVLLDVQDHETAVRMKSDEITLVLDQLQESLRVLIPNQLAKESHQKQANKLFDEWSVLKKIARDTKKEIALPLKTASAANENKIERLDQELKTFQQQMKKREFFKYDCGRENALLKLDGVFSEIRVYEDQIEDLGYNALKFGNPESIDQPRKQKEGITNEVNNMKALWDHIANCQETFEEYMSTAWPHVEPFEMEDSTKKLMLTLKNMKVDKRCDAYNGSMNEIKKMLVFLPLIGELRNDSMRERHWDIIRKLVGNDFKVDETLLLRNIYEMNLNQYAEDVEECTDQARQEAKMEKTLEKLKGVWENVKFEFTQFKDTEYMIAKLNEDDFEALEEDQTKVTAMLGSRYLATFEEQVNMWNKNLELINSVVSSLREVQQSWGYLENLFIHSEEVKKELPKAAEEFVGIDEQVKILLKDAHRLEFAINFSTVEGNFEKIEKCNQNLIRCEKALNKFMADKRGTFPRFHFVSDQDLLDMLSNGNQPEKVMEHMPKIFQAIGDLKLQSGAVRPAALGMISCVGSETVMFTQDLKLMGKVECYLQDVIDVMRKSLRDIACSSFVKCLQNPRTEWLKGDAAQCILLVSLSQWVSSVEKGFKENNIAGTLETAVSQLTDLIKMVMDSSMSKALRTTVMCMITMDAHSRDIIQILKDDNVKQPDHFKWQSQMKAYYEDDVKDFNLKIADASFYYGYEYLGNGPRLVVTPLTDRIYVTATQALHLQMGCAPAGPAGTGKTETTKDLSSCMGKAVYVFNCSDQMDYIGLGGIFKGLAASGSWGCFDEFNRLIPEVLSVCSVQFKAVTDAIKQKAKRFVIQDEEVDLDPSCGAFITMNPGYIGRSELPEGLKALFRPITVVVPDLNLICQNMLMAEGFIGAQALADKFTTLYFLCKDLLSAQKHYDWGLRAIKSVLVVAGVFKRAEPDVIEDAILMRALRDFNLPKIAAEDLEVFMGLLGDLFPGINPPRKRDMEFEHIIEKAADELKMYKDPEYILKIVQLKELMEIRHSVFTMGPPGAGKSMTWKTLARAWTLSGTKCSVVDINPKVVSTNEFYGVVHPATREWIDGLFSCKLRDFAKEQDTNWKWVILDGDLDANWIESMNSVMDDNKLLTLASNERIALKPHMKLIFEIRNLNFATPATVSRAGILYISDDDGYQWRAYVKAWIGNSGYDKERKESLTKLFNFYIPDTYDYCRKNFKNIVPTVLISQVMNVCKLLEVIFKQHEVKGLEYVFVFCVIWCMGAGLEVSDGNKSRQHFDKFWRDNFKIIKFPSAKTVFDYYVDMENSKLEDWNKLRKDDVENSIDTSNPITNYTVPTPDTIASQYIMKKFIQIGTPPMLVGMAGCGKTQIIKGLLQELVEKGDEFKSQIVNFNFFTDSTMLQKILESQLQKAGAGWGPEGQSKLIYFVDDLNMPQQDPYETQTAIALVRQHMDYSHWYDKQKLVMRKIMRTQYVAAMNATAGSFTINPRLQRWFWLLSVSFPESSSLQTIYSAFMMKHYVKFKGTISEQVAPVIKQTLQLHNEVAYKFRKTAKNFHYEFNVRHLTNVFQGLLTARVETIKEPEHLVRLWVHECERIYGDRLVDPTDLANYRTLVSELAKKNFPRFNLSKYFAQPNPEPLVFAYFVESLDEKIYDQFPNPERLNEQLNLALREYNELNAVMDLVLFEDAMKHVCKVTRILTAAAGHALLVGVGGMGKQSLSRLSAFICAYSNVGIVISSSYSLNDFKTDLQAMFMKAGVKDEGLMFLFTEGQIKNEGFLVFLNDLLSSGEIADLFAVEDVDSIITNCSPAAKSDGVLVTPNNVWNYFIGRVKKNLHMALCMSPSDLFRSRARKFPALINCTVIDWFHPWPQEALLSVATKQLEDVEMANEEERQAIIEFMPFSFGTVNAFSDIVYQREKRHIYTTPKSFLELIALFKQMLTKKRGEILDNKEKYEKGVQKLQETGEQVAELEENLKVTSVVVEEKKKNAAEQAEIVGAEKDKVAIESDKAAVESAKCAVIARDVAAQMEVVNKELEAAIPALEAAEGALNGLNVKQFSTLKALTNAPKPIQMTFGCVMHLFCSVDPLVPVDKKGRLNAPGGDPWKCVSVQLKNPKDFLEKLKNFKGEIEAQNVPAQNFEAIQPTLDDENFVTEKVKTAAECCGNLCDWVKNIKIFYDIFMDVEPKKVAANKAKEDLETANAKKEEMETKVAELTAALNKLQAQFQEVMDDKAAAEAEAEKCANKLDLAQRLVNALGSESVRWAQSILDAEDQLKIIIGDVLLASAFVSYVGPFSKKYREEIVDQKFLNFFKEKNIPMSPNSNPLDILTNPAVVAKWNTQKLPSDAVSTENGAILTNSARYSLIIDPQLQGITWLREKEADNDLQVTRLTNPKIVKTIENSVEQGLPVLIENLYDTIDAVLQPVYARAVIKKGRNRYLKMGDKELSLHPNFNLYMHTKLSNPHYQPEIQAECTLINFTVTESGLEDQLLDLVVGKERPDLAQQKVDLIQQMNNFKITLGELEADLLYSLANSTGDILDDVPLVEKLEKAKMLSVEIAAKIEISKETSIQIHEASEAYRSAANRGALVFFLMNELYMIHDFYKFSLDSFVIVVQRAIDIVAAEMAPKPKEKVEGEEEEEEPEEENSDSEKDGEKEMTPRTLKKRVDAITESITYQGYNYTRRGTFEKHKLLIATMLCLRIQVRKGVLKADEVEALVMKTPALDVPAQPESLKIINETLWPGIVGLQKLKIFSDLCKQMENEALQWKKWYGDANAESCDLPRAYAGLPLFQRLLLLRTMRPDRLTGALTEYVREQMGNNYIEQPVFDFESTYNETTAITPMFFVLFPGENPTPLVEDYGMKLGKTIKDGTFTNISMGQGQEKIAEDCLTDSAKNGKWIMIQNVHLMITWMKIFERKLEIAISEDCHPDFRCFISSEPLMLPGVEVIPESILQNSIKVANEAPQDLKANLRRAFSKFPQEHFERAKTHKEKEYKALLFGLCMFHSIILGRKKFGSQGWSRNYSFNDGDLTICGEVLHNYLAAYEQIPYDDLKYIFGEIMYGGHITDNLDRRTNSTYLEKLIKPEILLQMNMTMWHPGFKSPDPMKFDRERYENYIETALPMEVPEMFGLHKNAEIGYLTQTAETLFSMIQQISGGSGGSSGSGGGSKINDLINLFLAKTPHPFASLDLAQRAAEKGRTPYVVVCLQESERMNVLLRTIRKSLQDLDSGLKGTLNITEAMENLQAALLLNKVPANWFKVAYHSNKDLLVWLEDLIRRCDQFTAWGDEFVTPNVLWISGLFNPMSYLTAIMQVTARKSMLPLDDMCLQTEVLNVYDPEEKTDTPAEGGYIYGLSLEGAGWELGRNEEQGYLCEMVLKELSPLLPIVHVTAVRSKERVTIGKYHCPVYFVTQRGQGINNIPNFVTFFYISMESEDTDDKYWILSGVALFFAPEQPL